MHIVCSACATTYEIDPASLGVTGRQVRCSRCGARWFAKAGAASAAPAESRLRQLLVGADYSHMSDIPGVRGERDAVGTPAVFVEAPPLAPPVDGQEDSTEKRAHADSGTPRQPSSHWIAGILLLSAGAVAIIGARAEVVRYLPRTAPLFAVIGIPVSHPADEAPPAIRNP